jgi:hypothetical protein
MEHSHQLKFLYDFTSSQYFTAEGTSKTAEKTMQLHSESELIYRQSVRLGDKTLETHD